MTTSGQSLPLPAAIRPPALGEYADVDAVKRWRKAMRQALLAERLAVVDAQHLAWSATIHRHLARAFREVDGITIGFYWPHQGEFDIRPLMRDLLVNGAICALPVVAVPKCPLLFREWRADTRLDTGLYGIPVPVGREKWLQTSYSPRSTGSTRSVIGSVMDQGISTERWPRWEIVPRPSPSDSSWLASNPFFRNHMKYHSISS